MGEDVRWIGCQLLLVAGCTGPSGSGGPADLAVQDLTRAPHVWVPTSGRALRKPTLLGDIDGDGWADASVISWEIGGPWDQWKLHVIRGPLRRDLQIPRDADATMPGVVFMVGNAFDNGGVDVVIANQAESRVVDGPALLSSDPYAEGVEAPFVLLQVDGDGILDRVDQSYLDGQIDIRFGPAARWTRPEPDLTLTFGCDDPEAAFPIGGLQTFPDVTGDGRMEAFSEGWNYDATAGARPDLPCSGLVYPLPDLDGPLEVDVNALDGVARDFAGAWEVVSDETGDGIADLLVQEADGTWAVYGAPVTFASFGELSSDLVRRPWPWAFEHLYGLPVDATGNQIPDYLAVLDDVLYLVPGGAGAGRVHGPVAGWRLDGRVPPSPDLAFREADGASMLVDLSGSIAVIDLEPGGE